MGEYERPACVTAGYVMDTAAHEKGCDEAGCPRCFVDLPGQGRCHWSSGLAIGGILAERIRELEAERDELRAKKEKQKAKLHTAGNMIGCLKSQLTKVEAERDRWKVIREQSAYDCGQARNELRATLERVRARLADIESEWGSGATIGAAFPHVRKALDGDQGSSG